MELKFLRQEAVDALRNRIGENINLYAEEKEDWTESFFFEKGIKIPLMKSDIFVPDVELLLGEDASQDIENAIRLHTSLKDVLKPVQASDRRLWVALSHTVFYPYMTSRWPVENKLNEHGTNGTVTDRYFAARGLFRNGISRLYWLAELTYDDSDDSLEDPYENTRFLMKYQDLINQVDGRSFCRNKNVLRSCLRILKNEGELSERQKRLFFEGMCKQGGVRILDALPKVALDNLCKDTLNNILETKLVTNNSKLYIQAVDSGKTVIADVCNGKLYIGKTFFKTKPTNLSRLTIGKEFEMGNTVYRIIKIE